MVFRIPLMALLVAILVTGCEGKGQDFTQKAGAFGTDVVNAVVDRIRTSCVFSEDRLFLRRAAFVASEDGKSTSTYRPGFHGGIWQVNEAMFSATKACSNSNIQAACGNISSNFGFDWTDVTWSDMRKPLYSGLAAALSTLLTLGGQSMPGNVTDQAAIYANLYGLPNDTFLIKAAQATEVACSGKLDLLFILDSSGSVSFNDFKLMTLFAADVVNVMNVSSEAVRIAAITFSSRAKLQFDFDDFTSNEDVRKKLRGIFKISGGTNTYGALTMANTTLHDVNQGARQDAKKVAVLVTDGHSNSFTATNTSAQELKKSGTTMFAVGVGGYNLVELQAVASDPVCSHVLTLTSFDHIQSIITEIQKSTCDANTQFTKAKPIKGTLPEKPTEIPAQTTVPDKNQTIEAKVSCGILNIYTSTTVSRPSSVVFDERYRVTDSAPAELTITETLLEGTTLYITVVGTRLPDSAAALRNCTDYIWSLEVTEKKNITVICEEDGVRRPCTNNDVVKAGLCEEEDDTDYPIDNPCTEDSLDKGVMRHSHPYDPTKFIQCDLKGHYYITSCPSDVIFNKMSLECGFTSPGLAPPPEAQESNGGSPGGNSQNSTSYVPLNRVPLNSSFVNPCTGRALKNKEYYHKYDANEMKFIQCNEWGKAFVMNCGPGTKWSQSHLTCIKKAKAPSVTCSPTDNYLPDPCDHSVFYQCVNGREKPTRQQCAQGLHFNNATKVCDFPGNVIVAPIPASCSSP